MADSYIQIEGGEREVENLTPHISPVGGHGAPKIFFGGRASSGLLKFGTWCIPGDREGRGNFSTKWQCRVQAQLQSWQHHVSRPNMWTCRVSQLRLKLSVQSTSQTVPFGTTWVDGFRSLTGKDRKHMFLYQRVSIAVQHFNAVLLHDGFVSLNYPHYFPLQLFSLY